MSINRAAPSIATPLPGSLTDEAIAACGIARARLETPMITTASTEISARRSSVGHLATS